MRWLSRVALIAGLTFADPLQVSPAAGTIFGRGADRHGREFSDATITARPTTTGPVFTTASRHDGTYRLTVPAGMYAVTVTLEGFDGVRRNRVAVAPGAMQQVDATVEIGIICECIEPDPRAPRPGMIIGNMADARGNPLPFAIITVSGKALKYTARGYTDANGNYAATLPPGEYTLSFSCPGFDTLRREDRTVLSGWSERLNVRLETTAARSAVTEAEPLRHGCFCPGRVFKLPARD